jgi:hypothetical protein
MFSSIRSSSSSSSRDKGRQVCIVGIVQVEFTIVIIVVDTLDQQVAEAFAILNPLGEPHCRVRCRL